MNLLDFRTARIVLTCWAPVFVVVGVAYAVGGVEAADLAATACGVLGLIVGAVLSVRAWRTARADDRAFARMLGKRGAS